MISFRKKIFLSDLLVSLLFFASLIPLSSLLVDYFLEHESDQTKDLCRHLILFLSTGFILINRGIGMLTVSGVLRPIQQIFDALRSFKEGKEELLPQIVLKAAVSEGEFSKLASILNALTTRIQRQIENLTKQKEETKKILESLGEGIIALDPSAKVTFANPIACQMLKTSQSNILGKTLSSIESTELREKCHQMILHALQTSESISYTWIVREKRPLYLELIASPLAHQDGALLVLQDKTSDYQIIGMGKDFVANASHELRTPITIIRGFAETLQDVPNLSVKMKEEITGKIVKTCIRLDKLVRSLLTLEDVENLSLDRLKKTDLVLLVENCCHWVSTSYPEAQISFSSESDSVFIVADADLLELAISNILENGIKYSKSDPKLEVQIHKVGDEVELMLKDNGIGIPDSDLERIFDRFYTVDKARSRKSGGAGLGLSIVKNIIDKHKGKIRADSLMGKGSTFTFILPIQELRAFK